MKKSIIRKILSSVATLIAVSPLLSYAATFTPAKFGQSVETLTQKVKLPASFGEGTETVAVYCQADVMSTGSISAVQCYEHGAVVSMLAATESALKASQFVPATVDGRAIPVRMQLRVVYSLGGTQAPIVLLPNLGTLQAKYGADYYAPQERLDTGDWYQQYVKKEGGDGKLFFSKKKNTRVMANIQADGQVESVNTIEAVLRKQADAEGIESALKKSHFVPGFVQDKPTAMHYIAVVNYQK